MLKETVHSDYLASMEIKMNSKRNSNDNSAFCILHSAFTKNSPGFTLLELMMSMALLGIFMVVLYGFLNYNFSFLNTHGSDQAESLELRKVAERLVSERNLYDEITTATAVGLQTSTIVATTSTNDLKQPVVGSGLIYSPAATTAAAISSAYALSYYGGTVYYKGKPFAQGLTGFSVARQNNVLLVTLSGTIQGSTATEIQIVTLPLQQNHWQKGG